MSEQESKQASTLQRPTTSDDNETRKAYWEAQGQSWRTEPEIDVERQEYLTKQQNITPNIEQGIYPFKDIKLSRADVEWLLSKEEGESNLTALKGETQYKQKRLDLRAANLSGENLSGLPLSGIYGGLSGKARLSATREQRQMAGVHMERCDLQRTNLAKATLCNAYLQEAKLSGALLKGVDLSNANLEKVHLEGADLNSVILQGASLRSAFFDTATSLENVSIANNKEIGPQLVDIHWGDVNLSLLDWSSVRMLGDEFKTRRLVDEGGEEKKMNILIDEYQIAIRANRQLAVVLRDQGINEHADWFGYRAQVLKRRLLWKQLRLPIILRGQKPLGWKEQVQKALIDGKKYTGQVYLRRMPRRVSIISLLVLMLLLLPILPLSLAIGMLLVGVLRPLARKIPKIKKLTPDWLWLKNLNVFFKQTIFAFLAILLFLISSFIYSWFAYSTWEAVILPVGLLEKVIFVWFCITITGIVCLFFVVRIHIWWQKIKMGQGTTLLAVLLSSPEVPESIYSLEVGWFLVWMNIIYDDLVSFGQYLFSLLLDILSGYGYKPVRTLFWYLIAIFGFASTYYAFGEKQIPSFFPDAVVFSLTAFHGRGFFPDLGMTSGLLHNPLVVLAAFEAVVGLIIEISFIATFTQRYFGK